MAHGAGSMTNKPEQLAAALAAAGEPSERVECRRAKEVREAGACVEREDGIGMCDTHGFFMSKEIADASEGE